MSEAVELEDCVTESGIDGYSRHRHRGRPSNNDGGNVEDVLKRLGAIDSRLSTIEAAMPHLATKAEVAALSNVTAIIPHLATKADVTALGNVTAVIPHLATKADVAALAASLGTLEIRIIKWMIATAIAVAGMVLTIGKLMH